MLPSIVHLLWNVYFGFSLLNRMEKGMLCNVNTFQLKDEINRKAGLLHTFSTSLIGLGVNRDFKDSLGQGQFWLYRSILYIQQWIYAVNEMEGGEMLKSPSGEVLSTGAWYKKTPNDNLHTLATAGPSEHMSVWCQAWDDYKRDIGSKNTSAMSFLLNT